MIRRLGAILLAAVVLVVGLAWADEDGPDKKPKPDSAPRLKRKKRAAAPAEPKQPGKAEDDGPKDKPPGKGKGKPREAEPDDAIVPEDGADPEEDDQEVLERLAKNMRAVEEKLGNREVGEPTRQQQRDILKDIDALLRRKQQQSGGGGAEPPPPQGGADQDNQQEKQGGAQQKQRGSSGRRMAGKGKQGGQRNARAGRQRRPGRSSGRMTAGRQQPQGNEPQPMPQTGNEPGQGGSNDRTERKRDPKDPYKDVWGHLPESLRAQMDAYSNPQPFMPRYDDLVKKYYRTIAEQGRKKGD
jgi:hypothetical protein